MGGSSKSILLQEEFAQNELVCDLQLRWSEETFGCPRDAAIQQQRVDICDKHLIMQLITDLFVHKIKRNRPLKEEPASVENMIFYLKALSRAINFDIQTDLIGYLEPIPEKHFSGVVGEWVYIGTRTATPEHKKSTDLNVLNPKALFIKNDENSELEFIYFGEMIDDCFDGQGLLIQRRIIAKGCFSKGKLRGEVTAKIINERGDFYVGQTSASKPDGIGKSYLFEEALSSGEKSLRISKGQTDV